MRPTEVLRDIRINVNILIKESSSEFAFSFQTNLLNLPFGKIAPAIGGDNVVRKIDYGLGWFTTIDPLWEEYYALSPYHYSMNNPVSLADYYSIFPYY